VSARACVFLTGFGCKPFRAIFEFAAIFTFVLLFFGLKMEFFKNLPQNYDIFFGLLDPNFKTRMFPPLKLPSATSENIEFVGCYICCATYSMEYNLLQEAEHCFEEIETIWIVVRRKQNSRNDAFSAPLYYQNSDGQFLPLVDVELDTNLPEQHWLLRGVKFCAVKPLKIDPKLI
jgi:hypothetical protein